MAGFVFNVGSFKMLLCSISEKIVTICTFFHGARVHQKSQQDPRKIMHNYFNREMG